MKALPFVLLFLQVRNTQNMKSFIQFQAFFSFIYTLYNLVKNHPHTHFIHYIFHLEAKAVKLIRDWVTVFVAHAREKYHFTDHLGITVVIIISIRENSPYWKAYSIVNFH